MIRQELYAALAADAGGFRLMEECLLWLELWSRYVARQCKRRMPREQVDRMLWLEQWFRT
jgi:hypothetical protein